MVLAKEHAAVTGPRSGSRVRTFTHTALGCLESVYSHIPGQDETYRSLCCLSLCMPLGCLLSWKHP